jgi:hypothetical protein
MHVGDAWMGSQMWVNNITVASAHKNWEKAKDHMKDMQRATAGWANENGVTCCPDKPHVVVMAIGKINEGCKPRVDRPGISWTKWSLGEPA